MEKLPVLYARFQDDWIIIAKQKCVLRQAIKITNQILNRLEVEKHPDKTFIGRRSKHGLEFLGFSILAQEIVGLALATQQNIQMKLRRLYETQRKDSGKKLSLYIKHIQAWIKGILGIRFRSINPQAGWLYNLIMPVNV